jgi:hypothetical protein
MNCNASVKINNLPECIENIAYNPYYLENLVFDDIDTDMIAKVKNVATGKVQYIDFQTNSEGEPLLDINGIFPLMDHVYVIEFVNKETGNPETFTITNANDTTSTGCSIEFGINVGQTDNNGFFWVSSQECGV